MIYKYYQEIQTSVHYLYAQEVAEILYASKGITTSTGKPAIAMVSAILNEMESNNKLYYNTRNGLRRVYPTARFFLDRVAIGGGWDHTGRILHVEIGEHEIEASGRKYKYSVRETENK